MSMTKGIVYILTNPCFDGWVKIGMTERNDLESRLRTLNAPSNLPLSFRVYAVLYVENPKVVEQSIHGLLDHADKTLHAREKLPNGKERVREFFHMSPERAYGIFKEAAKLKGIEKDLHLIEPNSVEKEEEKLVRRKGFSFQELGVPIGSELVFLRDENVKVITVDDRNQVMYDGRKTTLSNIARELLGYRVSGALYFLFENETLNDRRARLESD